MQFACVEYTTKTGVIWKHRPERPNYLCDPVREIDPTSFGCYTSALSGEHIPLSGLIYGSLESPPSRVQRYRQDIARKLRGTFRPYDLSPLKQFDVLLVIYQVSNDDELVRFAERVRSELPQTILVSSSSPPYGRLREAWRNNPQTAARYQAFLDASHFNMNVCRATVPYYRLLSETPSLYLPQPYPVEYALQQVDGARGRGQGTKRDHAPDPNTHAPVIYVAGDTVRPDIMTGHLVARVLQERRQELLIRVTKTPEFPLNTSFLTGARYDVVPFRPWAEQLRELAGVELVINTDLWWTRGRVPVDCAAAGVPCVGTTSDGQTELWPDLASPESLDVDRLVELGERVLTDEAFRTRAVETARRRLRQYSYASAVERLSHAVSLARAGRLGEWRDPAWEEDTLISQATAR